MSHVAESASISIRATGLLAEFSRAGVVSVADVQVAAALLRLTPSPSLSLNPSRSLSLSKGGFDKLNPRHEDELVGLAAALCVRAVRHGSVALDLGGVRNEVRADEDVVDSETLPWPDPADWAAACRSHRLVADGPDEPPDRPLRWDHGLLYLQKYWQQEDCVAAHVAARSNAALPTIDEDVARDVLAELFPEQLSQAQQLAAAVAGSTRFAILSGGPGTGKTTTIARLLVLLHTLHQPGLRIALAAPTGKAAARITEAAADDLAAVFAEPRRYSRIEPFTAPVATTLHRLLGWRPDYSHRFRHDRNNPLPHDVVIVDEVSMVSLTMMARLMEALRPHTRLVLVGDPDQLTSIEAGAILADLVAVTTPARPELTARLHAIAPVPGAGDVPATGAVSLWHNFRSTQQITALAGAIRAGDADRVLELLRNAGAHGTEVSFAETQSGQLPERVPHIDMIRSEIVSRSDAVTAAARNSDAWAALEQLDRYRILCAHRNGPFGATHWNRLIESWLVEEHGLPPESSGGWRVGQSLVVTKNDYRLELYNGDSGVVVATPAGPMAAFARTGEPLLIPPVRLNTALSMDAMTIHRGQGSQFHSVTVILPPPESPLLTRELLYTAVTRAQRHVRIVGSEEAIRAAVDRRVARASGLQSAVQRHLAAQ